MKVGIAMNMLYEHGRPDVAVEAVAPPAPIPRPSDRSDMSIIKKEGIETFLVEDNKTQH
jgi:hypothetical protein